MVHHDPPTVGAARVAHVVEESAVALKRRCSVCVRVSSLLNRTRVPPSMAPRRSAAETLAHWAHERFTTDRTPIRIVVGIPT